MKLSKVSSTFYASEKPFLYNIRGLAFILIDKLTSHYLEKRKFRKKLSYNLNLTNPISFSQKVVWKKLYDRNPLLPIVADKYKIRHYVTKLLGEQTANEILVPLIGVTNDPENIPFQDLPDECVIKTNHNSGPHIFIEKGRPVNREYVISTLKKQLNTTYALNKNEWAYWSIDKKIIIETLLRDEKGKTPKDYKFFMINGQCQLVQVDHDRFLDHSRSLYDSDWNYLNVRYNFKQGPQVKPPKDLNLMLRLANILSKQFDFIRIDFYQSKEHFFLGEMTHYPESGMARFTPLCFDFELGSKWKLKPNYWEL